MRLVRMLAALAAAVVVLAGCVGKPGIPFDRTASQVKTIGIITPRVPPRPTVALASTVGQSFGLIGAMIDAGMQSDRESRLTAAIEPLGESAPEKFMAVLTADLLAQGYTLKTIEYPREIQDFVDKYPTDNQPPVDAYLDLVTVYGYAAAGISSSSPYRPLFAVSVKMVSAKDQSVLMQEDIVYNLIRRPRGLFGDPQKHTITVSPDPAFQFSNFDALIADPTIAMRGMQVAAERSAQTLSKLLR
jgi:ABC-type glycerol-3-phosphate transport system substrate-binding protein